MILNIHAGHNPDGKIACGSVGILKESTEARKVKDLVISQLQMAGHTVYDCTVDNGSNQSDVLKKIVGECNSHSVDLDVSIHLNSGRNDYAGDGSIGGTEVWCYGEKTKPIAERICEQIASLGFRNRGVKYSTKLYVLRKTKAPAILIECAFVDDADDAKLWNAEKIAAAIVQGITGQAENQPEKKATEEKKPEVAPVQPETYCVGKTYTLQSEMKVRTGPGTQYRAKSQKELTADGRKHDKDGDGALDKGTQVTCKELSQSGEDIWMRTPSGWIAAYFKGKAYVR